MAQSRSQLFIAGVLLLAFQSPWAELRARTTTDASSSGQSQPLTFYPVTPCRVADTRGAAGIFGGPTMTPGSVRSFPVPQSGCNVPATAQAYSLNVTVVPHGPLSYLTLWPTGQLQPFVSTLNSFSGTVVANAAIVPAGAGGAVSVFVTNLTDVILDINGYFDISGSAGALSFYPATPCRVADTRGGAGTFGGPSMLGGQSRDFPIPESSCGVPATARGYSLNVTVVPAGYLGYLTTWPTGQAPPNASTLNSWTGKVVANAALVPAGTNESISVYVSNPTDVILDINGYFGQPGGARELAFYPVTPCRVADTRSANGLFGGPEMGAGKTRSFAVPASGCSVPSTAAAYSLNVTVVPDGPLSYLSAWPTGSVQPLVSTLNSFDGAVVANAAIVPAGPSGAIDIFVTNPTHVILDINGYFAPPSAGSSSLVITPPDGATTSTTPSISVAYSGGSAGLDLSSLSITLDGVDSRAIFSVAGGSATLSPVLAGGQHVINASIKTTGGTLLQASSRFTVSSFRALPQAIPASGVAPLAVTFVTDAEDTGGAITRYQWSFNGDSNWDTDDAGPVNQSHTFYTPGIRNSILKVTDDKGQTTSATVRVNVTGTPPTASAQASPSDGATPLAVSFSAYAYASTGTIARYEWDFNGDGVYEYSSTTTPNTQFTYTKQGTYTAALRVTDSQGLVTVVSGASTTVRVGPANSPTATIDSPSFLSQQSPPAQVYFDGHGTSANGNIVKYEWDFNGDGCL